MGKEMNQQQPTETTKRPYSESLLTNLPDEEIRMLPGGIRCHVIRIGRPSARVWAECMARVAPWLESLPLLEKGEREEGVVTDGISA
jgi:hypothetical protein